MNKKQTNAEELTAFVEMELDSRSHTRSHYQTIQTISADFQADLGPDLLKKWRRTRERQIKRAEAVMDHKEA